MESKNNPHPKEKK
jgi:hypothetical protein